MCHSTQSCCRLAQVPSLLHRAPQTPSFVQEMPRLRTTECLGRKSAWVKGDGGQSWVYTATTTSTPALKVPCHAGESTGSSGEHPPAVLLRNGPRAPRNSPSSIVFSLISSSLSVKLTPGSKMHMESPHRAKLCSTFPVFSFQSVLITQIMCLNRSCPLYN